MAIKDALLPEFDQEMATTRRLLALTPEPDPGWKPHEKSMTLGRLATHIAELPGWAVSTMQATEFDMDPEGGTPYQPPEFETCAQLLDLFDGSVARAREQIAGMSDADFLTPWALKRRGETLFEMPRAAVFRSFILSHLIHHRGQFSVYLRLLNVPLPSIYGPSADTPM